MKLKYQIEILSEWHIGSGLGAGAETDAEILKDENGLPFIPGKTIKGLLKDAFNDITDVNSGVISKEDKVKVFGDYDETEKKSNHGSAKFSNAVLLSDESDEIIKNGLKDYLYKNIASTAIDKNGIADEKSLRTMEVCMPLTLEGSIFVEADQKENIRLATKWVRHLGVNRNRGLGRCKFIIE
jgi:CRISPR/Cas system CSM-associated protein Csm3 (group 7 of RAMP superfamily)